MAISDTLSSMATNISNAYDAINSKGGTVPAHKNLENLSTAINSISGGSQSKIQSTIPLFTKGLPSTWTSVSFTGLNGIYASSDLWSDGENIYYSNGNQYVLNKSTMTWSAKTWNGTGEFSGNHENYLYGYAVWTDQTDIYYTFYDEDETYEMITYVLDKNASSWSKVTFTGTPEYDAFDRNFIWYDGENVYYSHGSTQYILNKSTRTWSAKTWVGLTNFDASKIWTDGSDIYYSNSANQYKLNKNTSTWTSVSFTGYTPADGKNIWYDGENVYYSYGATQYVFTKSTMTWSAKTWNTSFYGSEIWTDGSRKYHSQNTSSVLIENQTCYKPTLNS